MARSIIIGQGIWQFEFMGSKLAVAKWDQHPSTEQWVEINHPAPYFVPKYHKFYLEGTCVEDIHTVPYEGPAEIGQEFE